MLRFSGAGFGREVGFHEPDRVGALSIDFASKGGARKTKHRPDPSCGTLFGGQNPADQTSGRPWATPQIDLR